MNRFKKGISLLLVAAMILPLGTFAFGEETDILGHWAKEEIQYLIGKEVVSGYSDGNFRPDQSITRAEFIKIINNIFGYSEKAEAKFGDVKEGDWFYDEIRKATKAGYIGGYNDGTIKPNNPITRQEVSKIMGMVFDLDETKSKSANNFADSSKIGDWAKGYVSILKDKGYISGYSDNTFRPTNPITRAEAVKIITNASGNIINLAGEYSDDAAGNVLVNTSNVELKDMKIKGDLYLVEGIGEGDIILDNVVVEGSTYVRGGGENSIIIRHSKLGEIVINKDAGDIRVVLEGETIIEYIAIESGTKLVVKEGVKVDSIKVTEKSNIEIEKGAEIGKVEVEARDTEIKAKGKIESIVSKEDVKVNDEVVGKGKEVKVEDGKVTEVKKDKPKPEPASSAGGGGGGGGGGGRRDDKDDEVAVTGVSVSPKTMTLTVGKTGKITATVKPDNATNKKVNWTTSDESIATVANGVVTAKAAGTATITATSDESSDKFDVCEITVKAAATGTKDDFLADLEGAVEAITVAEVTLDGDNISVVFDAGVTVEEVTEAAEGLVEALGKFAGEGSTLEISGETFTLNEDFDLVALAKALLDGTSAEDFLTEGKPVSAAYTAKVFYKGTTVNLEGTVSFDVAEPVDLKDDFLADL
ncbi:S-layer homology domain-containing protein, partial [Schnuerera ultunensis]|uniref:S-layer homology domain-containing protein n=1 Tax=Schnuerera ultunensis TaxID=45497 RepID=UPI000683F75D